MCAEFPGTLTGLRDRALLLLGFAIAGRRSEPATVDMADIADAPQGLVITVRVTKTKIPHGRRPVRWPPRDVPGPGVA